MKKLLFILLITCHFSFGQTEKNLWQPYRISERSGSAHVDLSGTGWTLGHTDQPISGLSELKTLKDEFETSIPNSVHWSYYKAGKLPHPYYHKNSEQYLFMDEKVWYYRKSFKKPAHTQTDVAFLCFDGVDYFARVWLNDSLLGVHEGMFGGPTVEVSRFLKDENELVVEVRAGNWGQKATRLEDLPREGGTGERDYSKRTGFNPRASGKIIKPWVISGGSGGEAFFSVGMWQGVRLEIMPAFHLERPYLTTKSLSATEGKVHLSLEVFANAHSLQKTLHPWQNTQLNHPNEKGSRYDPVEGKWSVQVEITPKNPATKGSAKPLIQEFQLKLYEGRNWLEQDLTLPNPALWNPNGLGDANLYEVKLTLKNDQKAVDQLSFDYGLRTIERVATAGPRTFDRWENWQFVVNGQKIFVKGMNFTPQDILLDLPYERYRWTLEAAKKMGVQLIRIWGGGLLESDHLYDICNELGIMVWQDFPIGNQDTPGYPQDVWEAQVVQNIFRLRNHPSLAVWCGGNEFNPYSYGNAASIGILERNLDIFDKSVATAARFFVRTTPDDGSMHAYPDMDPNWYNRSYKYEAWVSETGMHSIPEPAVFRETVNAKEFFDLGKMWEKDFADKHPEFTHHFTEYGPSRVPRMLSRASHISDMKDPSLETISEATQVGAGEFYQIFSEKMQGNYPVTAGLMPWVFKRHWPVIAIQLMDWFGNAAAPYYFLKRTYEPTHVAADLPRLLWKSGENLPLNARITHSLPSDLRGTVSVSVLDDSFKNLYGKTLTVSQKASSRATVTPLFDLGSFSIPTSYNDRYLFVLLEFKDQGGKLLSRSFYFPRVLSKMQESDFYNQYVNQPMNWITLENGPFLKPTVEKTSTQLTMVKVSEQKTSRDRSAVKIRVTNTGKVPAFMMKVYITGTKRAFTASDNFDWLAAGESRLIDLDVLWREPAESSKAVLEVSAWNAPKQEIKP
ncbi:glycoside hydrolase family 2 protein [Arundinibacter roseus]|uniref:beta-mannosidase n=1 Tax=Arundinibacter roseus TaxID=2070510 RepID=A0A4R4KH61_9BACT|nr:beta-mannosidase [Arundinibacter roseus]TDB67410.1 beta-mannosidase [Arundinibacter roseus]